MAKVLDTRRMLISTLSPIHMGTDQDYEPTNYVIDDETLYEFDPAISVTDIPAAERPQLERLLRGRPDPNMLKGVQSFFYRHREWLIPSAINRVPVNASVDAFYRSRIGSAANVEADGQQVLNKLEIERAFYNPVNRLPLLPGSGLKGAIRTALLDAVNNGGASQTGESHRDLQKRLFQYGNGRGRMDLHRDPMRLFHVGDASWVGGPEVNATEVRFAVNRKKRPLEKNGSPGQSVAEKEGLYQLLECVPPFRLRSFESSLSTQDVSGVSDRNKLPDPNLRFSFGEIARACNRFYRPILQAELELLRGRSYADPAWRENLDRLLSRELERRLDANQAFLLRVGRHSGAESVTLNGVRSIKIMRGRGERPEFLPYAKTLWLAAKELDDQRHLIPFGWLIVEVLEEGTPVPDWPGVREVEKQLLPDIRAWRNRIEERTVALQTRLDEQRKQVAERAAQEAAERAEKEAREKRLAIMSDEEKAMEDLSTWLEEDKKAGRKEPGGRLASRIMELFNQAQNWNAERRRQLAALASSIYTFIGWGNARKKKERRTRIEALRGNEGE